MAQAYQAFVSTYVGGGGVAQSGFWTFTFHNTQGFDAYLPIIITCPGTTSISAGGEVTVYRSTDGGGTWETEGSPAGFFVKPSAASQIQRDAIMLGTGSFLISVQVGGGCASTWTAQTGTAWVITAYA